MFRSWLRLHLQLCMVYSLALFHLAVKKCEVEEVADVGKVVEDNVDDGCGGAVVVKAEVVAVIGIDS